MTEAHLLKAAVRQGCKVSSYQVKRWRGAGLLPRPSQDHPAGQVGSTSTYPSGTLRQLLAVCRMHERFRSLERVRFELWWEGEYRGDIEPVREYMVRRLDRLLSPIREFRDRYDDPLDAAEAAVDDVDLASRNPGFRAMRRFAKTDDNLRSAVVALLCELFGGDVAWDSPDTGLDEPDPSLTELVERVTGAARAKTDSIESGEPLLGPDADVVGSIQLMIRGGVIDLDHPGSAIATATDEAFDTAAAAARLLVNGLGSVARVSGVRRGRDFAGLSFMAALNGSDPTLVAFVLQLTLCLPSLLQTEAERAHAANTYTAIERNRDSLYCIEMFCHEHPGYAFIFKPDAASRLQKLSREERALLNQTIEGFQQRHPKCAALMEADE